MKAIVSTAKTMYWTAYGLKDANKAKARKIFKMIISTLSPDNEYYLKSKTALESM